MNSIPFQVINWNKVEAEKHTGETGTAYLAGSPF